jgi:hypothetical protein
MAGAANATATSQGENSYFSGEDCFDDADADADIVVEDVDADGEAVSDCA